MSSSRGSSERSDSRSRSSEEGRSSNANQTNRNNSISRYQSGDKIDQSKSCNSSKESKIIYKIEQNIKQKQSKVSLSKSDPQYIKEETKVIKLFGHIK